MDDKSPIILAYSGGLDTSFCVPWLQETYNRPVITATINTGGLDDAAAADLEKRALALGAVEHVIVEARELFFNQVLRHLIAGNVRRGQLYPLCVGAERGIQAEELARLAIARGSKTVAHGCTAAGNDQVRFEVALKTLGPDLDIIAPVRDQAFVRSEQVAYLQEKGFLLPASGSDYSYNPGLGGISIGGKETQVRSVVLRLSIVDVTRIEHDQNGESSQRLRLPKIVKGEFLPVRPIVVPPGNIQSHISVDRLGIIGSGW